MIFFSTVIYHILGIKKEIPYKFLTLTINAKIEFFYLIVDNL